MVKKIKGKKIEGVENPPTGSGSVGEEMVTISKKELNEINNKLEMLYNVADKGRIFNYESNRTQKKPLVVKLSKYSDGIIIGWRTIKDELVKHPTTGVTVGEVQEYELLILDSESKTKTVNINGYPAFSTARYNERIDCEVIGRKESFEGVTTFDVKLPDGRIINLDPRFVN